MGDFVQWNEKLIQTNFHPISELCNTVAIVSISQYFSLGLPTFI